MLSFPEYLSHLDADAHLLAAAAGRGMEAVVPGCPGWTVLDLVLHTARVHINKADIVEQGWVDASPPAQQLPAGMDPLDWYRSGAARVYRVLSAADPSAAAYSWADEQTVGFWIRRMAHETVIHRVDAEQAHGYESMIDAELAIDGIAEIFDVYLTGDPDRANFTPSDAVVRVQSGGESWTVRFGRFTGTRGERDSDRATTVLEERAEPGVVISGDPDRVLLWMWGRGTLEAVTVAGDVKLAHRLREVCSI